MSNRTDFNNVALELVKRYETELQDAFVAGQEQSENHLEKMRQALTTFVDDFENPSNRKMWYLNDAYERACAALGRETKEIE